MISGPREGPGSYVSDQRQTRRTYRPVANGRPVGGGYVYRAPGWRLRARRSGIDPDALIGADAAAAAPGRRRKR